MKVIAMSNNSERKTLVDERNERSDDYHVLHKPAPKNDDEKEEE